MPVHRTMLCIVLEIVATAISCAGAWGQTPQKKDAQPDPPVRGVLMRKSGSLLFIQADGDLQPRRFDLKTRGTILEPKFAAYIKDLPLGTLIELSYGRDSAGRRSSNILVLAQPGSFGAMAGIVTDKSDKVDALEVRDDAGKMLRFCPHWRVGGEYKPPGNFDKEMLKAIVDVNVGDRVEVYWTKDDHLRVSTLRLLDLSERGQKKLGDAAGIVHGKVAEKGKDWISIQAEDGDKQRYVPQRIIGAHGQLDYDIVRTIGSLKVGDPVEARWFADGERRLYYLKVAGK